MNNTFGDRLRRLRRELGLTQSQLALKLEVQQQTVARWERGSSRPSEDNVARLATMFEELPEVWLEDAGYGARNEAVTQPVRPLTARLPLGELAPTEFERFIVHLVSVLYPSATSTRVGTSGHKQHGADVIVRDAPNGRMLIQCKRVERFGPADVERLVRAAEQMAADVRVLALSRVASPGARDAAERHGWVVWDHDDIVRMIQQNLSPEDARRIVDSFFPGHRQHFLGLDSVGPWMKWDEYFGDSIRQESAFSHTWDLVGRAEQLETLVARVNDHCPHTLLVGDAGVGKSRLLLEVARRSLLEQAVDRVYFVDDTAQVRPEDFERLGARAVLLVVDDAHNRDDIEVLLRGSAARRSSGTPMSIILSSRPYGRVLVTQDLARIAGEIDVAQVEVPRLSSSDSRTLAASILGANEDSPLVQRLVTAVGDSTLFTVAGAFLVRAEQIDPVLLGSADGFRELVLDRMRDDYVRAARELPGGIDSRELLYLVAAAQPFESADGDVLSAASTILGAPRDTVVRALGQVGATGVVAVRGTRLRIQPDLLADHMLVEACFDRRLAVPTGYADSVWESSPPALRRNLLVNLARIDWRLSATGIPTGSLLDSAWKTLEDEFRNAGIGDRESLMGLVENIAYYQPEKALSLVRWALENELPGEEAGLFEPKTYASVRRAVVPVLKNCAYHLDHLQEAIELLWSLASTDSRPAAQFYEHPLRVLTDLASYSLLKPIDYSERVVDGAIAWLPESGSVQVFDILDEVLALEAQDSISEGYTIKMTSYSVLAFGADRVRSLRVRALKAVLDVLDGCDLEMAARAVQSIEVATRSPFGLMGRKPSEEERAFWAEEAVSVLTSLGSELELRGLDATIRADLRETLLRLASSNDASVSGAAESVLGVLDEDLDVLVAQALMHGPWQRTRRITEEDWSHEKEQAWLEDLADKLMALGNGATGAASYLEERMDSIRATAGQVSSTPGPLVATVCRCDPRVAGEIVRRAVEKTDSSLTAVAGVALSVLRGEDPVEALRLAELALAAGRDDLKLQVAHAYGWGIAASPRVTSAEFELIGRLAKDESPYVGKSIAGGFRFLAVQDPRAVVQLILSMHIGRDADLADEALTLFSKGEPLAIEMLDQSDIHVIVDELVSCDDIDQHWITEFLGKLTRTHLRDVVMLFRRRVELAEAEEVSKDYRPVPFGWEKGSAALSSGHAERAAILADLRDWAAQDAPGWRRHFEGPRLFAAVAGSFDTQVMDILETGLSADSETSKRVAHLLSEVRARFAWENVQWIVRVLEETNRRDPEVRKAIASALHSAVISGSRVGTPGQPFPQDLEQRAKAQEIADSLPRGSLGERFYRQLQRSAEEAIRRDRDE